LARAGQTTFTPVAHLSSWVQRSCPGQFVCERSRRCIDLKLVCDGKLDCDDNSDEMNCDSGCADTPTWLSGDTSNTIEVSQVTKSCTWIYERTNALIGTFEIEHIIAEGPYRIVTYDSADEKWMVYDNNPKFLSSRKNSDLTFRIELENENSLLYFKMKYYKEDHSECGVQRFKCPNSFKCLASQFVCNGFSDCPGGEDELNCPVTCDAPRYLTAVRQPTQLKSRNFPYPWLGRGECAFTIKSESGNGVRIDIVTLQIDANDPIEIYEGSSCDQKLLKRLEGGVYEDVSIQSTFDVVTVYTRNSDYMNTRIYSLLYYEL